MNNEISENSLMKKTLYLKAYAKLNFFLNIVGIKDNGYHLLEMIMQSINLYDNISIKFNSDNLIRIESDDKTLPTDEKNIVYRACREFLLNLAFYLNYDTKKTGFDIFINKNIPQMSGMAGGSADCAAVLIGCNELFGRPFSCAKLLEMGENLGSDVPFALTGGTCKVTGVGDQIENLSPISDCVMLVVKPHDGMSTKKAFDRYSENPFENDFQSQRVAANFKKIVKSINNNHIYDIADCLYNKFEELIDSEILCQINEIKACMIENGALSALMTGSGTAVFGIFLNEDIERLCSCQTKLMRIYNFCKIVKPIPYSVSIDIE